MINIVKQALFILETKHKFNFLFISILILINTFFETLSIAFIIPVISAILDPVGFTQLIFIKDLVNYLDIKGQLNLIILVMAIMITIFSIKFIFGIFLNYQIAKLHFILKIDLSKKLLSYYLNNNYQFFLNKNSSELIRNIEIELSHFTTAMFALMKLLIDILIVISLLFLLILVQPFSAFLSITIIALSFIFFYYSFKNKLEKWGKQRQFHDGNKIKILRQSFDGIKEIKIFFKELFFINIFNYHNYNSNIKFIWLSVISSLIKPWGEITFLLALTCLLYITFTNNLEVVEILKILGLYSAVALKILPSANQIINNFNTLKFVKSSLDCLFSEFSKYHIVEADNDKQSSNYTFNNSIELNDLSFKYTLAKKEIFKNVNLKIKNSSLVAIIGSSGAGKSTLVDIIMGLLKPTAGKILIDGKELLDNIKDWQLKIGYVPQNIYLFDDTVRNNIALGIKSNDIDDKLINSVVEKTQLKELINSLPQGLDTFIGERGLRISGGQKQRIGLARALYLNPKILILDEATNALDISTEEAILNDIKNIKEITIIYITHKKKLADECDIIIDIDKIKF